MLSFKLAPNKNLIRVEGELSREFLLSVHMLRSPKHFKIFRIGKKKEVSITDNKSVVIWENGRGGILDLEIGRNFIKVPGICTYYVIEENGRIFYVKTTEIETEIVTDIELDPSKRYVGPITHSKEIMIQNSFDEGKISFRNMKQISST